VNPRAGILVTGTEVLTGIITDRNGPWLSERLIEIGVDTEVIQIVGDRPDDLLAALEFMRSQGVALIVTSGGLGPTADDLTAEVVGRFAATGIRPKFYEKLLSAGINVVTTSTTRLVNPHAYEPAEWRDQLAAAAKEGQVSLYASGIEPGFAADYLPLVLTTQSSKIEKIHAYEIGLYDDYGVPDIMSDALGFGRPLEYQPWISFPGAISGEWQGQIRMIADALGEGKTVLFVSAKMAALEVVHDRLAKLGFGRFCLEAHSTKAGKARIIDDLRRTLEAAGRSNGADPR